MIRAVCPTCASIHQLDSVVAGQKITCPDCGQQLRVPGRQTRTVTVCDISGQIHAGPDIREPRQHPYDFPLCSDSEDLAPLPALPRPQPGRWPWQVAASLGVLSGLAFLLSVYGFLRERRDECIPSLWFALFFLGLAITVAISRLWLSRLFGTILAICVATALVVIL